MKVNDAMLNNAIAHSYPEMNTQILQAIERLAYNYSGNLLDGWRCCVEFQDGDEEGPYYLLDVESNRGGGGMAPIKMQMLKLIPEISATGTATKQQIIWALKQLLQTEEDSEKIIWVQDLIDRLEKLRDASWIDNGVWTELEEFGLTRWYGGIRIPYSVLTTRGLNDQVVEQRKGEIRITFSGAKEWQDVFYAFRIFQELQTIINDAWKRHHFRYEVNTLNGPVLEFWRSVLQVQPVPGDNKIIIK